MRITWRGLRSSDTFHPQIRYNWNFGVAQESTFLMDSMLPNSHFNTSYPSVLPHWYPCVCTCSRDNGILDIPLHHAKLESALRILQQVFLLPGAFPVPPLFMAHSLFQVSIQMSLSQRCLLRPPNIWGQHPSSCFCSLFLLLLPFSFTLPIFLYDTHWCACFLFNTI